MKIISRDEILNIKYNRRKNIELQYHANGDCIHIGKISKGCKSCFIRNNNTTFAVYTGCECNVSCGYCYYEKDRNDKKWNSSLKIRNNLSELYKKILNPETDFKEISFNSFGETLFYREVARKMPHL